MKLFDIKEMVKNHEKEIETIEIELRKQININKVCMGFSRVLKVKYENLLIKYVELEKKSLIKVN